MNHFDNEHIEIEPFDREYRLEELLPREMLDRLAQDSSAIMPGRWALFNDGGTLHFQYGPWPDEQFDRIQSAIATIRPEEVTAVDDASKGGTLLFPIEHELETKGYMGIYHSETDNDPVIEQGRAGVCLLKQLLRLKHQTMLTSGLHGMVVEESYAELKSKATQLAKSEEKYRLLSANLEVEVQKKTEEIRIAHAHLMQQEKMAAIGQLSAGMAHEINNPLGFILSNLNTLKSYGNDLSTLMDSYRGLDKLYRNSDLQSSDSALDDQCKVIEESEQDLDGEFLLTDIPVLVEESVAGAERIKKIVKDLKAVARPGETHEELINIHESIDAVLTIVENRVKDGVTVRKTYGPVPLISGQPQEISQIWLNLIANALDALAHGGILEITTKAGRDHVMVSIKDSGDGISPDHLNKVFDPFFTTKKVGQGTGLGLHLVYHLVTKQGGKVDVHSEMGKGSVFSVCLPASEG